MGSEEGMIHEKLGVRFALCKPSSNEFESFNIDYIKRIKTLKPINWKIEFKKNVESHHESNVVGRSLWYVSIRFVVFATYNIVICGDAHKMQQNPEMSQYTPIWHNMLYFDPIKIMSKSAGSDANLFPTYFSSGLPPTIPPTLHLQERFTHHWLTLIVGGVMTQFSSLFLAQRP